MIQGIDISYHQEDVDAQAVKDSGLVNYIYLRVGTGDGAHGFADSRFHEYYDAFRAVGIPIGPYHVFEPSHDPTMQFAFFNDAVGERFFELPVWLDVERNRGAVSYAVTRARWVDYLQMFDDWGNRKSGIYTSKWKWQEIIQPWWSTTHLIDNHPLAVAAYGYNSPPLPNSWDNWTFWQTNNTGRVPGIIGNVDVDYFNGTAEEFLAFQNLPEDIPLEEKVARLWTWAKRHDPEFLGG